MKTPTTYIDVAVALPVFDTYTYEAPDTLTKQVNIGCRVLVPFGHRKVFGYILAISHQSTQAETKAFDKIIDDSPLFPKAMISFFQWIADYYFHPIGLVIKTALPTGLSAYEHTQVAITEAGKTALSQSAISSRERTILNQLKVKSCRRDLIEKRVQARMPESVLKKMQSDGLIEISRQVVSGRTRSKTERVVRLVQADVKPMTDPREKIIEALANQGDLPLTHLKKIVPTAATIVRGLTKIGSVKTYNRTVYRDPFGDTVRPDLPPRLTVDQQAVLKEVSGRLGNGFQSFLLAGVTGSGKTEVYLRLAEKILETGHQVLVLVPEIALISLTERRFRARFGDRVAVLHSRLSSGERYDQWRRIVENKAPIVIGARSAVFAPLTRIGIIIVDEEHDTAFKQESGLRYNGRDLAVVRAKFGDAIVLLGSATPSVQTFFNTETGKSTRLVLPRRIEKRPMPEVSVFDLRLTKGMRGSIRVISEPLHRAMRKTLSQGKQVLLFLNRRGFAGQSVCLSCGEPVRCRHCDITLTFHQAHQAYQCHYCGFSRPVTIQCGVCGSSTIRALGIGTEKVEALTQKLFPDARICRMDRDTTTRKGSIKRMLKQVKDGDIDILIGTQMVAKGHDFPNITLVGIICADLSLDFPDFRAGERTFQLLAQVAGRAGRGDTPGQVILQTYNPDHFTIIAAKDQNYRRFYKREIPFRKTLQYPPFTCLVQLKISGRNKDKTGAKAKKIGAAGYTLQTSHSEFSSAITILGPIEAPLTKISGRYRWQIFIKGRNTGVLHRFVRQLSAIPALRFNDYRIRVAIDVDPYLMM